jgi:adenine-specific DNA-methyltransferase
LLRFKRKSQSHFVTPCQVSSFALAQISSLARIVVEGGHHQTTGTEDRYRSRLATRMFGSASAPLQGPPSPIVRPWGVTLRQEYAYLAVASPPTTAPAKRKTYSADANATLSRRVRDLRRIASRLKRKWRMTPLQLCEAIIENRLADRKARAFFSGLPNAEKHYWISSLYALLMPKRRRQRLAAYFTPPHLVHYIIETLLRAGIEPGTHRIMDPASGGAAFLVPLAARIARNGRKRGLSAFKIRRAIELSLAGVEIEPDLAALSKALLADLIRTEFGPGAGALNVPIANADTLLLSAPKQLYDAVVGNPPYGRVFRPAKTTLERFAPIISDGYVNLYALFVEQAIRWVRPGGVVCLIVPASFVGGPYFAALRQRILETSNILSIDLIDRRSDVFLDVLCDVCVLILRKKGRTGRPKRATSSLLIVNRRPRKLGHLDLPKQPSTRIWALPDGQLTDELFQDGFETLKQYGYVAKTGYFVWNREQDRYRKGRTPKANEVPLFWARNIKPNVVSTPSHRHAGSNHIGFVRFDENRDAIINSDAVIIQRTSNRGQNRRLNAAIVRKSKVPGGRGFVTENHTILILPDPSSTRKVSIKTLCRLINTQSVDARFRRMSGSVSVSTKALRDLPLPLARDVCVAFKRKITDEDAAELAYARSQSRVDKEKSRVSRRR